VNFPEIYLPRNGGYRMAIVNSNVPNMVGQISTDLAAAGLNILDMLNRSRGEVAVTLIDIDRPAARRTRSPRSGPSRGSSRCAAWAAEGGGAEPR
jgi:D-3-phosphoglycerate dehydrogenase / 2-oxoglutarate reductase